MRLASRRNLGIASVIFASLTVGVAILPLPEANAARSVQDGIGATGPFNSVLNTLKTDNATAQSETSTAVCDGVTAQFCFGTTVMVGYNDLLSTEGIGYSYSFDGGTRWTDGKTLPLYTDSSGTGKYIGDPMLAVSSLGTFYFTSIALTHDKKEFVGMNTCAYSPTFSKMSCSKPKAVTTPTPVCNSNSASFDKPAVAYDAVNNRVYVSWTYLTYDVLCAPLTKVPQFRYYDITKGTWSQVYNVPVSGDASGTAPVVKNGELYLFFEDLNPDSIQYVTFSNGSVSSATTVSQVVPAGYTNDTACGNQPVLDNQAWNQKHAAIAWDFPAVAVDGQGNIYVTWNGAPTPGEGSGQAVIYVATLPSGGGSPNIQELPDGTDTTGHLLIQWQPSVAFAGGSNGIAVGYFQVVQGTGGGYRIQRNQVTATAGAAPAFGPAQMISTTSWRPPPNSTPGAVPCYEGDYSLSASDASANVVWSYWGDSRKTDPSGNPEQDIYGLFTNAP